MKDTCAPAYVLGLLGRKWPYRIMRHLPARFSEIEDYLPSITNHVLAGELKLLQNEGLAAREDGQYFLTAAGQELFDRVDVLLEWVEKYKGIKCCSHDQKCSACARYRELELRPYQQLRHMR